MSTKSHSARTEIGPGKVGFAKTRSIIEAPFYGHNVIKVNSLKAVSYTHLLENKVHLSPFDSIFFELFGRSQQHRNVAVMPAGVVLLHLPVSREREAVNVRAQAQHRAGAAGVQHRDGSRACGEHLWRIAKPLQQLDNVLCGCKFLKAKFRMLMKIRPGCRCV